ncbi:MAG: DUF998 domain-containing protein [Candidatus Hadarchaeales archaeon]
MSTSLLRKLGLCGLVAPPLAFTFILLSIHLSPSFSWTENALSDLGVGETAPLFNSGLMAAGLLLLLFSLASLSLTRRDPLGLLSSSLLALDSLALFGIGLFPESYGDLHFQVSVLFFILFPFIALSFSLLFWRRSMRTASLLSFLLFFLSWTPWAHRWEGLAIPETLSSSLASAYVMVLAALLFLGRPPYDSPEAVGDEG